MTTDAMGESDYEKLREANIKRNQERMAKLQLPEITASVAVKKEAPRPARKPSQRGVRKTRAPVTIARRSLRVRGMKPNGELAAGVEKENRDGSVVLKSELGYGVAIEPKPRRLEGPLAFESIDSEPDKDAQLLDNLRRGEKAGLPGTSGLTGASSLARLGLESYDVVKLTRSGIVHVDFAPRSDYVVVAGGDKEGHVGFWGLRPGRGEDEEGNDLVLQTQPHLSYVSGLKWRTASELLTCSYDGTVRKMDAQKGSFLEVFKDDDYEFSSFDFTKDGSLILVCDNEGGLLGLDHRCKAPAIKRAELHTRKINTVHLDPSGGHQFVTSSTDTDVCVWDARKVGTGKPSRIAKLPHMKSCQAAYLAPDGSGRVLTTCYDDNLRIWDVRKKLPVVSIKHDNHTGRWVVPFRAAWTPASDGVLIGSMKRQVEVFSAATGKCEARHVSEYLTAIASRHAMHRDLPIVASATSSGRLHLFMA